MFLNQSNFAFPLGTKIEIIWWLPQLIFLIILNILKQDWYNKWKSFDMKITMLPSSASGPSNSIAFTKYYTSWDDYLAISYK